MVYIPREYGVVFRQQTKLYYYNIKQMYDIIVFDAAILDSETLDFDLLLYLFNYLRQWEVEIVIDRQTKLKNVYKEIFVGAGVLSKPIGSEAFSRYVKRIQDKNILVFGSNWQHSIVCELNPRHVTFEYMTVLNHHKMVKTLKCSLLDYYRLIVFDFDNTLCDVCVYTLLNSQKCLLDPKKPIVYHKALHNDTAYHFSRFFSHGEGICNFLRWAKAHVPIKICIASFGNHSAITRMSDCVFVDTDGEPVFDYIITPDNYVDTALTAGFAYHEIPPVINGTRMVSDPDNPGRYSKNFMIQTLMKQYAIRDYNRVLFFDDDKANTGLARNKGIKSVDVTSVLTSRLVKTAFHEWLGI